MLVDCFGACGLAAPYAILDSDCALWGQDSMGIPIMGGDDLLAKLEHRGVNSFVVGLGSVGDNKPRKRLFELGTSHRLQPLTIVHPTAICSPWAKIGPGSQLLPGSIVNAGAVVGANVIVNSGAIVEHDCTLGNHSHVATGARLAGAVQVGEGVHIGAGATVKQGVLICDWVVVGAGAVVIRNIAPHTTVVGVPAQPLRDS